MSDTCEFIIHKFNRKGERNKRYELNAYLIKKYIISLGFELKREEGEL